MKKKEIDCSYIKLANDHTAEVKNVQMVFKRRTKKKRLFHLELICYAVATISMLFREEYLLETAIICGICLPLGVILDILRCRV